MLSLACARTSWFQRATVFSSAASRAFSSDASSSLVSVTKDGPIATLSFVKKPVNTLNYELLKEFNDALKALEADSSVNGLILTSGIPKIFSAGLDITEMYQPKPGRVENFWTQLQNAWINLYGSRLATVAAINGQTLAGGCLLAMTCDYRIMAEGGYRIGLNETQLGIVAPSWFIDTMVNTIGQRQADKLLQLGALLPASEALRVGLVDEVVPEGELLSKSRTELQSNWLKIPAQARFLTKLSLRKATIDKLAKSQQQDVERFAKFVNSPAIQQSLGFYLSNLKAKSGGSS